MRRSSIGLRIGIAALAGVSGLGCGWLTGCGTPAAPQPPSLKLPLQVEDLTAVRAGDRVTLRWTNPRKTTDRLLIQGPMTAEICRLGGSGACDPAGESSGMPGAGAEFQETLPAALAGGEPRVIRYFVELRSPKGRTAGPSNMAEIAAGSAPGPVTGFAAEVRASGVVLRWDGGEAETAVRLHRRLLTPPAEKEASGKKGGKTTGLTKAPKEPVESDLMVDRPATGTRAGAQDTTARFGESYEYRAQRVMRVKAGDAMLELDGPFSAPVRVDVIDRFPPAVPQGLVAVAAAQEKSIDLSWEPVTDADLAGYIVYRAESKGAGSSGWKRISGPQPLTAAAYRDLTVAPGRSYRYRVTAIDETGHESAPSAEAEESMPNP